MCRSALGTNELLVRKHPEYSMTEIEFEVWQNGAMEAGGTTTNAKAALHEADHYALMYGQDGPVEVKFFVRQSATREELERFAD